MRAKYLMIAAALLSLVSTSYAVGTEPSATGLWQSVDDDTHQPNAWFLIRDGGGGVYAGAIVRMFLKPGEDPNVACDKCADDRRNKPWMGLEIIRGMKRDGMKYTDGTILDPRDGNIYSAQMTLTPDGQTLVVRGYLGISIRTRRQRRRRASRSKTPRSIRATIPRKVGQRLIRVNAGSAKNRPAPAQSVIAAIRLSRS
jgi:hypothetical protein